MHRAHLIPSHHKNSEKKRRGNPFPGGKIEIDLIGQIYQSGTDTSPHNSFLRHISSQGRNLETFIEMVNFLDKRWKNAFKHTYCKWLSYGANFQGAKIQGCDCYKDLATKSCYQKKYINTLNMLNKDCQGPIFSIFFQEVQQRATNHLFIALVTIFMAKFKLHNSLTVLDQALSLLQRQTSLESLLQATIIDSSDDTLSPSRLEKCLLKHWSTKRLFWLRLTSIIFPQLFEAIRILFEDSNGIMYEISSCKTWTGVISVEGVKALPFDVPITKRPKVKNENRN